MLERTCKNIALQFCDSADVKCDTRLSNNNDAIPFLLYDLITPKLKIYPTWVNFPADGETTSLSYSEK